MNYILTSKTERLRRSFKNKNDQLVNVTSSKITIFYPDGSTALANGVPTNESTGIYYYDYYVATAAPEGVYKAFWEGTLSGELITMNTPEHFYVRSMDYAYSDELVLKVRRLIGDMNPDDFRVQPHDLLQFIKDGVDEAETDYNQGYTATVTKRGVTFNKTLTLQTKALITWKTVYLILTSMLMEGLWDIGNFNIGDISANFVSGANTRIDFIEKLEQRIENLLYDLKIGGSGGELVDLFVQTSTELGSVDYPILLY